MNDIDWSKVTHPFLPNRANEKWITSGNIDVQTAENGDVTVTNESINVSVTAPTFDEAILKLNNKVTEELKSGKPFEGRYSY